MSRRSRHELDCENEIQLLSDESFEMGTKRTGEGGVKGGSGSEYQSDAEDGLGGPSAMNYAMDVDMDNIQDYPALYVEMNNPGVPEQSGSSYIAVNNRKSYYTEGVRRAFILYGKE